MTASLGRLARTLLGGIGPIAIAVLVQSAGNLGFHAVVGRELDADAYGALGAVLSAMVMLGVPLGALQAAASALVARHGAGRATGVRALRAVTLWSLPPGILVLACAPGLQGYFHLGSLAQAALLAPYLVVSAVLATARGLLLGDRKVGTVATTYLVSTAARLALGLGLVIPYGVTGALAGTLIGEVAALALALVPLLRRTADTAEAAALQVRAVARAGVAVTGLFLFSTVDLLLARHHLGGDASGDYVAAATVAKTVLALPAGIMSAVFPRLAAAWPLPHRLRALLTGGAAVVVPALLGATVIAAVPWLVLQVLYGDGYADAAGLVRTLSLVAALTSVVTLATHAALARGGRTIAVPWIGAVIEVAFIEMWHGSPTQIAVCSAAALAPTLLVIALLEGRAWTRRTAQLAAPHADRSGTPATAVAAAR
ncbi:lipopolysaccharide biosynthesis protein [Krasilnikovia sp. MM14-A1259]|uniref:lipopolysaccharide biosynthesis protein n=1 Tax=Krasilnikovia sp. MM14-A1259 TaxID=3373539 RepID=UPI0038065317